MPMLNRRQFAYSAGAGLLLAPFASFLQRRPLRAAGSKRAKRLFLFCTMGTKPELWSPTGVSGENSFTFSPATAPLAAHKDSIVLIEGLPSGNPDDGHGAPDGLTGMGFGAGGVYYGGKVLRSVDQFVADGLMASGINRPIPSLLLGSQTSGGTTLFWRGNNLLPIASPASAFNTVFGAMVPTGTSPATLLLRIPDSIGRSRCAPWAIGFARTRFFVLSRTTQPSPSSAKIRCSSPSICIHS